MSDFIIRKQTRQRNKSICHVMDLESAVMCMIQRILARRCFKCFRRNSIDSKKIEFRVAILSSLSSSSSSQVIGDLQSNSSNKKKRLSGVEWRQQNQQTFNKYLLCNKIVIEQLLFQ